MVFLHFLCLRARYHVLYVFLFFVFLLISLCVFLVHRSSHSVYLHSVFSNCSVQRCSLLVATISSLALDQAFGELNALTERNGICICVSTTRLRPIAHEYVNFCFRHLSLSPSVFLASTFIQFRLCSSL